MKPALLVIDIQKQFYSNGEVCAMSLAQAVEYVNAAAGLFREKKLPIAWVLHRDDKLGLVPGYSGFDLPDELKPQEGDIVLHKTMSSSFAKTDLAERLLALGVDTVVVTGFCAEHCVLSTYKGAEEHGLTAIILRGGLASMNPERIRFVEDISQVVSFGALKKFLE